MADPAHESGLVPSPFVHATVRLSRPGQWECVKCNGRDSVVLVEDGIMADEERPICAPCLLAAVESYPEHEAALPSSTTGGCGVCGQTPCVCDWVPSHD